MNAHQIVTAATLAIALAAPGRAQVGTWDVTGEARVKARYEGSVIRGLIPIQIESTLAPDGRYEVVAPPCTPDEPPLVFTGTWSRDADRFLRAIAREVIQAMVTACGSPRARVRALTLHHRPARDGASAAGRFAARVRYQIEAGARIEALHARIRGEYTAVRRAE